MKITKRVKTGCALVLAGLLALSGLSMSQTEAAQAIDLSKTDCSIKISVEIGAGNSGNEEYVEDFNQMRIPVSLYRVADVDVTGQKFTPVEESAFTSMDFSGISNKTTASQWLDYAKEAVGCLENEEVDTEKKEPIATEEVEKEEIGNASAIFTNLTPGMYLVMPKETFNRDYTAKYQFTPYLTALPNSTYTTAYDEDGNFVEDDTFSDEWLYNIEIGLKPEAEPLYGKLQITKTLLNYNRTLQDTTFVFRVDQYDENDNLQADKSEVYSITFVDGEINSDADLSKTIEVKDIPAGWSVVVEEIYTGASYTNDSPLVSEKKFIYSQDAIDAGFVDENGGTADIAKVSFSNRYDGGNRGGYGVMNQFTNEEAEGGWIWNQITMPDISAGD